MTGLSELLDAIQKTGYAIDQRESNSRTVTLRHNSGGKVIARLGDNGKAIWIFIPNGHPPLMF